MNVENITAQDLLDVAEFIYLALDLDQNVVIINRKGCEILDCSEEEIIGKNWFDNFLPKEIAKDSKSQYLERIKNQEEIKTTVVNPIITKNGEERTISWQNTYIKDESGKISGVLSSGTDITERNEAGELLRKSEEKYRKIVETTNEWIWEADLEGFHTYTNPRVFDFLGYKPEEIIGKSIYELMTPEEAKRVKTFYEDYAKKTKPFYSLEMTCIHKNGKQVYLETSAVPVISEDGELLGYIGVDRDITKRKRAEEELKETEMKFKTVFENAKDGFTLLEIDGTVIDTNRSNAEKYGYKRSELIGKNVMDISPYDDPEVLDIALETVRQKKFTSYETFGKRKDGSLFPVEVSGNAFESGGKELIFAINRDITDRLAAEEALKESEAKYRTLIETMTDGLAIISEDRTIDYVNKAVCDILGYKKEEVEGKNLINFVAKDNREILLEQIEERKKGEQNQYELVFIKKDGSKAYVIVSPKPIFDDKKKYEGSFAVITDITERKRMEEEIRQESDKSQNYLDIANVILLALDSEMKVSMINRKGCELLGYTQDEILQKNWVEKFLPDRNRSELKQVFMKLLARDQALDEYYENSVLTKNGEERLIAWHNTLLEDDEGTIIGILSSGTDITEQRKVQIALTDSEEKYRKLIELIPDSIIMSDIEGKIIYTNQNAAKMYGFSDLSEFLNKSIIDLTPEGEKKRIQKDLKEALSEEKVVENIYQQLKKDGSRFPLELRSSVIFDKKGYPLSIINTGRDISERLRMEEELKRSEELYRTIFEVSGSALTILNKEGIFTLVNPKSEELYGLSKEEIEGKKHWTDFLPEDVYDETVEISRRRAIDPDSVPYQYESKVRDSQGNVKDIIVDVRLNPDTEERITSLIDITEIKKKEKELSKSEKLANDMLNNSYQLQGLLHPDGTIAKLNRQAIEFSGQKEKEIFGMYFWDINPFSYSAEEQSRMKEAIEKSAKGETIKGEAKNIGPDGKIHDIAFSVKPIFDEDNNITYLMPEAQDITEIKRADEALKVSEEKYRNLVETAKVLICQIDMNGITTYANEYVKEITGYEVDELVGKNWWDILYPGELSKQVNVLLEKFRDGEVSNYEQTLQTKSGNKRVVSWSSFNLRDEEGNIIMINGAGIDITQRREAEESVKTSEELYKALFENTGTGTMLVEDDSTISLCNKRLLETSGYAFEELNGKKITDFIPKEERDSFRKEIAKLDEVKATPIRFETVVLTKGEEKRNSSVSVGQIPGTGQRIASLIDITMEKKLENILVASEERLSNLVENVPIAIITMLGDGKILDANPEFWKLLSYDSKEDFFTTEPPDHWVNMKDRERLYSILEKKKLVTDFEAKIRRKDGKIFWGTVSAMTHRDISGDLISYQTLQDITSKKEMETELRQQLMKYKVDEANLYVVEEEIAYTSIEAFNNLLKLGYQGVVFSRTPESNWREEIKTEFQYYKLSEKGKGRIVPPSLDNIEQIIEELPSRQVILIDRLDYLIQKNGFENTLFSIYRLMDIAYLANHIILLSNDSSTLHIREKKLLQKELKPIEAKIEGIIAEDLFEILMFIYQKNVSGAKPTISDVLDDLQISRPTARKRIQNLIDEGYIIESVKGRSKILQVTQKGKMLF